MDDPRSRDGSDPSVDLTLEDGRHVLVRPIREDDGPIFQEAMTHLSETSRYYRFMSPKAELSSAELQYLTHVDGINHAAFGALDPGRKDEAGSSEGLGLGTARYVRSTADPAAAEIAVTVIDEYQGLGLGTALLRMLGRHAIDHGIEVFTAEMLAENRGMQRLLRKFGARIEPSSEDTTVLHATMQLNDPLWTAC